MADGEGKTAIYSDVTPEGLQHARRNAYLRARANAVLTRHIAAAIIEIEPLVPHAIAGRRMLVRLALEYLAGADGIDPTQRYSQLCLDMLRLDGFSA
jgi:hypothetical protein